MPSYKVLESGFFDGRLYDPKGKRPILHTDGPFPSKNKTEMVPKWLERIAEESATQKKIRVAVEKKAAADAIEKAEQDQQDIADMSFLGDGERSSNVEILG